MGKIEIIENNECVFERKMEKPQRAVLKEDWKAFKKFFEQDKQALLEPMDLDKNTAIHVATRSNQPRLLAELLQMLSVSDRWRALRRKNTHRNTILHHTIKFTENIEIVDVILECEKEVRPPADEEIDEPEEKQLALLEMKNDLGETPLYRAAKSGNIKLLRHMAKSVADIQLHFIRDSDKLPILHAAIISQHFGKSLRLQHNFITSNVIVPFYEFYTFL